MRQQISKKIFIYLFLFIFFGTLNNKNIIELKFLEINEINVSGMDRDNNLRLIEKLDFFKFQNIFFLDDKKINKIINENPFVEKFSILKIYPSKLEIKIYMTEFLAYVKKKDELFFLGSNRKLILTNNEKKTIPYIFGKFEDNEFFKLKNVIDSSNFDYKKIKNLYFFPSRRWDIETRSGILIKLPRNNLKQSLELSLKILSDDNFNRVNMIDLRQNTQVIINE